MHFSSLMTTLNPMTETTKPARLIQSPALIVTGSCVLITDKGARVATFALMTCDEFLGAERDLRTGATLLPWAILQPPISRTDDAARCQTRSKGRDLSQLSHGLTGPDRPTRFPLKREHFDLADLACPRFLTAAIFRRSAGPVQGGTTLTGPSTGRS
jgi:hypothetical protein